MKRIVTILMSVMLSVMAWAGKPAAEPREAGMESTLSVAANYLDGVYDDALLSLSLIAKTPEAERGDWPGIKRYLAVMKAQLPGAYFYVLPNGNYYSVGKDYTNLNLSDRPYFNSLFAGNPVRGFPIYSRSTGKKSALAAVPVVVDGKVTGALGISIFLEELHTTLNRILALPPNHTWFVLNDEGISMLDDNSDFIFMSALEQGSPSLRGAVTEALKHEQGTITYALDGIRKGRYRKLPHMPWWMFMAQIEGEAAPVPPKLKLSLERFVPEVQQALDAMDASMKRNIEKRAIDVSKEGDVRTLLGAILEENPYIVDAGYVDADGVLRYLEPGEYKNFENRDISAQAHVIAMRKHRRPLLSGGFMSVEDFLSVVIARPLFEEKRFSGAVTALIRPELFIKPLMKKSTIPEDYELWIMQPDNGMIVYDRDKEEIGKLLFSDPVYAASGNLLELGKKIAANPSGEGSYIYDAAGTKEKVIKKARWETVRLHGREWRVVLAYLPYRE
jgi:hypothetical protein